MCLELLPVYGILGRKRSSLTGSVIKQNRNKHLNIKRPPLAYSLIVLSTLVCSLIAKSSDQFILCPNNFIDEEFSAIKDDSDHHTISYICSSILCMILSIDPEISPRNTKQRSNVCTKYICLTYSG